MNDAAYEILARLEKFISHGGHTTHAQVSAAKATRDVFEHLEARIAELELRSATKHYPSHTAHLQVAASRDTDPLPAGSR